MSAGIGCQRYHLVSIMLLTSTIEEMTPHLSRDRQCFITILGDTVARELHRV